jgi:hypothetical protein
MLKKGGIMNEKEKKVIKDFLRGYEREELRMKQLEEDIAYLNDSIGLAAIELNGMPSGSGISDTTAKQAEKLCELSAKLIEKRFEAAKKRSEIADMIRKLPDSRYIMLLRLRYIELKGWAEVSIEMNRDPRWVFRLHNEALCAFEKIYKKT